MKLVLRISVIATVALIVLCVPERQAVHVHAAPAIGGYSNYQQIVVTGGSSGVSGSTTVAVPINGSDYVVQLHLIGSQAAAVYNGATDHTKFNDVSVWYCPSSCTELDIDYDPYSNGVWSSSNITLWFKLQANIAASPATDGNYYLAWGSTRPIVMRDWSHIYPLSDDFNSTAGQGTDVGRTGWNPTYWNFSSMPGWMVMANSLIGWNGDGLTSLPIREYGPGYALSVRTSMPATTTQALSLSFQYDACFKSVIDNTGIAGHYEALTTVGCSTTVSDLGAIDTAYHTFTIARIPGAPYTGYFWVDNSAPVVGIATGSYGMHARLDVGNGFTGYFDSVKIRPWIVTEPSVALTGPVGFQAVTYSTFSVSVTAGALSLSLPTSFTATGVTLNGMARTSTVTFSTVAITDARGGGAGWTLSINTPDLLNSGGKTIPFSGVTVSPAAGVINDATSSAVGGLTTGSSGALSGADTTPGTTASGNYTVLSAPSNQGMGSYTEAPGLSIAVPANTYTGAYSSTVTLTLQ